MKDQLKLKGEVFITVKDKDGKVKETRKETNLVVDSGLAFICSRMASPDQAIMTHMGLGSGSSAPAGGDTDLSNLLGARETLDNIVVNDNAVTYSSSFEAGDATGAVTEAGIFNAGTGGDMLCRVTFAEVNKAPEDTITINWIITLNAA